MDASAVQAHIANKNIRVLGVRAHSKASEEYVDVVFTYSDQAKWDGSIPYRYRRTGLLLESPEELADLIEKTYEAVRKVNAKKWVAAEKHLWETEHMGKGVTKEFFVKLLNLRWNAVDGDLPQNPNWARRIQDIKEMGYLLATHTSRYDQRKKKNLTHILLVPLEKGPQTGYEVFSPQLRKRIIKVLGSYDAYEGKIRPSKLLLPDHKFPEISWDQNTRGKNPNDMTDEEIRAKFQLLDNQRNLEKREACRRVVQTGMMGTIFGVNYYLGSRTWPKNIPRVGKAAERGWKLCPWYDIEAWRQSLNAHVEKAKKRR